MNDLLITALLVVTLFLILGSGVWIGLSLSGVAWVGMQLFSSRPAGDAMSVTIWGSSSSWTLTALPLFMDGGNSIQNSPQSRHVQRLSTLVASTTWALASHQRRWLHHLCCRIGIVGRHLRHDWQNDTA